MFDSGSTSSSRTSSYRPLPLKQRTSSVDTRRDFTAHTWRSLLVLLKAREYVFSVDNFSIWRRHLAWAMEDGKDLKSYMTGRYSTNMVFLGLLLSTELGVLFNSAAITHTVRVELKNADYSTVSFWAGFMVIISSLLTLLSLFSTFTAWALVNAVDEKNTHCIFRSSIGQYAAELPGRLIVCSIYSFLVAFFLFFFLLLPVGFWSVALLAAALSLFFHIVATFSALGRVIMHTGAMGKERVFEPSYEMTLLPHSLHANLLAKARANLTNNTSITRQYRKRQAPIDRHYMNEEDLYNHLCCRNMRSLTLMGSGSEDTAEKGAHKTPDQPYRRRTDSLVRFADEDIAGGVIASSGPSPPMAEARIPNRHSQQQSSDHVFSPMSDIMPSPANFSRKPPEGSLVVATDGPNSRPPRPKAMRNSPFRSSSSSLEQWLQASVSPTQDQDGDTDVEDVGPPRVQPKHLRRSPPPPPLVGITPPPNEIQTHKRDHSAGMSSIGTYDRQELTEDDRFMMDYGDDNYAQVNQIDNRTGGFRPPNIRRTDEQTGSKEGTDGERDSKPSFVSALPEHDMARNDIENRDIPDMERLSLLGNGSNSQHYSSTGGSTPVQKPKFGK